jgi:hypothetical protein
MTSGKSRQSAQKAGESHSPAFFGDNPEWSYHIISIIIIHHNNIIVNTF